MKAPVRLSFRLPSANRTPYLDLVTPGVRVAQAGEHLAGLRGTLLGFFDLHFR